MNADAPVLYERRAAAALITLNRPSQRNAMNRATLGALMDACDAAEADAGVRAVVLTGAGAAFSSGFDLKEQAAAPPAGEAAWRAVLREDFDAVLRFWHCPKPTIAAVNGPAIAGGCELALACDITIAAEGALFGEPELRFGAGIVVMLLPWLVGPKRAKELLLTGVDDLSAPAATAMGLVNRVVPGEALLDEALALAGDLAVMDPALVRATKAAINRCYRLMGLDEGLEAALADDVVIEGEGTEDKRAFLRIVRSEGLRAALAWRDARFSGPARD